MSPNGYYITVSYPRTPTLKFNTDYYVNGHLPLVEKHWTKFGLKGWSVVHFPEGDASGQHTQAILHFETKDGFDKAMEANIPEVMEDLKNYSNELPVRWFGEVLGRSK
ncbi:hypothetical protein PRZ48_014319 [Zasmidium cellare]|uniref:EthD domain-containing protein n=1 Tax=Zasmidium cellare TaxID=395010 RepID=A0ABR0E166_ZASCE|nr:hypothetical protein PRZ48_014319 [Zasmidium cellare]